MTLVALLLFLLDAGSVLMREESTEVFLVSIAASGGMALGAALSLLYLASAKEIFLHLARAAAGLGVLFFLIRIVESNLGEHTFDAEDGVFSVLVGALVVCAAFLISRRISRRASA
ncbi:hypothetical protein [Corynebacterium oculi]|uniref:hypothetical protein n=1 Tax=Corynebacterium oculi TaxID=1544416 RepID=UPI00123793C4|nr:hypothetical protein [Corynebacterium oculi]